MSTRKVDETKKLTYRIAPDGPWSGAWKLSAVFGLVGLAMSLFGMLNDPHRFAFSWLFAFVTFLAFGLGGLFVTISLHLTGAGWGITMRRTAELLGVGLPVFALLFIPLAFHLDELYPWRHAHHGEAIEHDDGAPESGHEEAAEPAEHGALEGGIGFGERAHAQEARGRRDLRPSEWDAEDAPVDHAAHDAEHALHAEVIDAKLGYLDTAFFFGRAGFYFLAWIVLSMLFFTWSTRQDKEKGIALTKKMQGLAPVATFVFGITLTFAAFDWVMSMEPSWYSTIFGVQYFAVSAVTGFAMVILITLGLRHAGLVGDAINVEHYHDAGKLLFGFIIFWAYVSFSQFMLIWYASIPEETTYYHLRWWGGGGFQNASLVLMIGRFVVPFFLLLSRNAKRRLPLLGFSCAWIMVFHVVELYWLVMPYAEQTALVATSLRVHWMDLAALFGVGGVYATVVLFQMTRYPLIPIGDPRLSRSLTFEQ